MPLSVSHLALDPAYTCAATETFVGSSSKPAGTQYPVALFSMFGTGLPHLEQKSDLNPDSVAKDEIRSSPQTHRNASILTNIAELDDDPLTFLHKEQWH
ncbi:MAG: hypothetical protein WBM41_09865 [Arenicellales bacterium]